MSEVLEGFPKMMDYDEPIPYLPLNCKSSNTAITPSSGSMTYADNGRVEFILPLGGLLNQTSLALKYQLTPTFTIATGADAHGLGHGFIVGTPAYSPFLRLEEMINSKNIHTVSNYNQVENLVTQLTMNSAEKLGSSTSMYGTVLNLPGVDASTNDLDSLEVISGQTYSFCAPIRASVIANAKKYIPLNKQVKFTIFLDTMENMLSYAVNYTADSTAAPPVYAMNYAKRPTTPTFAINNIQLCYEVFYPPAEIERAIYSRPITDIKSRGFTYTSSIGLTAGAQTGTTFLNYPLNYNSIKSVFMYMSPTKNANTTNGIYDSIDGSAGGTYQCTIQGHGSYPESPLSVIGGASQIIHELQKASTAITTYDNVFNKAKNFSITTQEFTYNFTAVATATNPNGVTSPNSSSKFFVGFHLEKCHDQNLFSGPTVTSNNLTIKIENNKGLYAAIGSITTGLIVVYDTIISWDNAGNQVSLKS